MTTIFSPQPKMSSSNISNPNDKGKRQPSILRQEMYKTKTPPWKETYRKRCIERLRENRTKHHSLRRCLHSEDPKSNVNNNKLDAGTSLASGSSTLGIDDIMETEWQRMQDESQKTNTYATNQTGADCKDAVDAMVTLYEDICEEIRSEIEADLRKEEARLLSIEDVCDEYLQQEEAELISAIKSLSTEEVICPLCEKSPLVENKGVIFCKCGLRINTEQDCISLKNVQDNLTEGTSQHSQLCARKPVFSLASKFGFSNLIMSCEACDFLFIVV